LNINPNQVALVIATDGVWKYLNQEKVGSIVMDHLEGYLAEDAANEIVKLAGKRWSNFGESMDDVTVVVVYLSRELVEQDH
jgi:serine/threonine protein phosphatase PrpC